MTQETYNKAYKINETRAKLILLKRALSKPYENWIITIESYVNQNYMHPNKFTFHMEDYEFFNEIKEFILKNVDKRIDYYTKELEKL